MAESIFIEIAGRLVQGDPFEHGAKTYEGKAVLDDAGQQRYETFVAIAVPKEPNGNANAIYAQIYAKAQQDFPNGLWQSPTFAWKCEDGDAGDKYAGKDWARGCVIFKLVSNYPVACFDQNGQPIVNPLQLKRGFYVRTSAGVRGNGSTSRPGVYLNLGKVQLLGYGDPIDSGLTFAQTFTTPAVLPFGASQTPTAAGPMPSTPGQPAPMVPGAPVVAPQPMPGTLPAPMAPPATIGAPAPVQAPAAAPAAAPPAPGGVPMPGTVPGPYAPAAAPGAPVPGAIPPAPGFLRPPAPAAPAPGTLIGYDAAGQPVYQQ